MSSETLPVAGPEKTRPAADGSYPAAALEKVCREHKLTEKQIRFLLLFYENGRNAVAAYHRAYGITKAKASAHWVQVAASKALRRENVRAAMEEIESVLMAPVFETAMQLAGITRARIMLELAKIGFANIEDYTILQLDGSRVIDFSTATRDQLAAVQEITVETYTEGQGEKARQVKRTRLKLHAKREALIAMGKQVGMFVDHKHLTIDADSPEKAKKREADRLAILELAKEMERRTLLEVRASSVETTDPATATQPQPAGPQKTPSGA
jgi:phage terminase small subunit